METGHYSAHSLVTTMQAVKRNPQLSVNTRVWPHPILTNAEYRAWFLRCLDTKINRNLPQAGRKESDEYQHALRMDCRTVNDYYGRRIRNTGSRNILRTPELRRLYPQVNCQPAEF